MISKNPIAAPKTLHYEQILYKVIMFNNDGTPVAEGKYKNKYYIDNRCYPAVEMLSIQSVRPSENKAGLIIEGILVDENGNTLPGRDAARDIIIPFEHDGSPFREGAWTDDLKLANQFNSQIVKELNEGVEVIVKEYTEYQSLLNQLVENCM